MNKYLLCYIVATLFAPLAVNAQEEPDLSDNEAAIRVVGEAYVKAFNARDAKALSEFWSPDAVYTNRSTGEQVKGRDAIEDQFAAIFKASDKLRLDVSVEAVQLISPNAAVEHGTATFVTPDAEPEAVEYTAVYIRRDEKWLLDNVTDKDTPSEAPSHYEHLKGLEWMVGSWVDEDENARIVTECNWTRNNNFMTRSFTVEVADRVDMAGMQIIAWDPAAKRIRSWTFDSDGGFSEGVWTKQDNRWLIRKKGTLADGRKVTAVNILKYVDDNTFTIQSVQRAVGGELLPNVDEVRVVRR